VWLLYEGGSQSALIGAAERVSVGCFAKLFTATLAGVAIEDRRFELDSTVLQFLGDCPALADALSGVTIKQLLEHTHGLDDSRLLQAPVLPNGRIDLQALYESLGSRRLHEPGRLYSYGRVGAWLLCAILERCYDKPYTRVLRDELLTPLGLCIAPSGREEAAKEHRVCGATGEGFTLAGSDLLRFLQYQICGLNRTSLGRGNPGALESEVFALPGWSPRECGTRLSWKHYGSGWFGHNSVHPGAPALLRVHPRHRIGFIVACTHHSPTSVATAVFGNDLPEFVSLHMPKLLTAAESSGKGVSQYLGLYQKAAAAIHITGTTITSLELRVHRRDGEATDTQPFITARLRPARDNIFFVQPADAQLVPFVQFVEPVEGSFNYLWNGTALWPAGASERVAQERVAHSGTIREAI
jgi:CubicO group peptidase (beta-lactamase class C family)